MVLSEAAAEQPIIYTRPVVYCVVPQDLAGRLLGVLQEWWKDDPGIEVIVQRRGSSRRLRDLGAPSGLAERRTGDERRSHLSALTTVADEGWGLPWAARRDADRLELILYDVPVHGRDAIRMERALIDRVRHEDGAAADQLYASYFNRVHIWAEHSVGRRHADAATQAIFDEAFAHFDDEELDERRFDRWLTSIATSVTG